MRTHVLFHRVSLRALEPFNRNVQKKKEKDTAYFKRNSRGGVDVNPPTRLSDSCNFKTLFPGWDNGNMS